jgi:CheY-like chemotaxis protein
VKPALKLEQCTASLRGEHLSVVLFGFPSVIRQALEEYLCVWFNCNLLENTGHIEPDVVLVEEGNNKVARDVEWIGQRYGRCCVLLSIAMSTDALGKPMRPLKGYSTWERILRPMGPDGLGKALSVCVVKLRQLREHGSSREQDRKTQRQSLHDNACPLLRDDQRKANESTPCSVEERSPASLAVLNTVSGRDKIFTQSEKAMHIDTDRPSARELTTPCGSFISGTRSEEPRVNVSNLCILVVDDNAVNRRLLGVFLQKYGCRDIQYAENGALAVKMAEGRSKSFDIIFMGTYLGYRSITTSRVCANSSTDISMPIMNGFTATREIRRIEHDRHSAKSSSDPIIPACIFALSGSASDCEKDEAFAAGIDEFVAKPVQFDNLLKVFK